MEIVKYNNKYYDGCKKICFDTASDYYKSCGCLYLMYLDYYLKYEGDNCLVLVDDDKIYGYLLLSLNNKLFSEVMKSELLPLVKSINRKMYNELKLEVFLSRILKKRYDSHMHIDLDSSVRRKGYGKMLINKAYNIVELRGNKGLYLTCGSSNLNARKFYNSVGFKEGSSIMGGTFFFKRFK